MLLSLTGLFGTACSGPPDQGSTASSEGDSAVNTSKSNTTPDSKEAPGSFSEAQWQKLDHALKLLFREGPDNPFFTYQVHEREGGEKAYGILIRTSDPKALSEADLPLGTPSSKIVTARLTLEEIRRATQLDAVVSVSNPSEATN